jgi:hypothetical protein
MPKLNKSEKKELKVLQIMCLNSKGEPKPDAAPRDLIRLSELLEKVEDKPAPKKQGQPKPEVVNDVAASYIAHGYEYLGTDGKVWCFKKDGHAFKTGKQGLENVGYRFAPEFLETLTK